MFVKNSSLMYSMLSTTTVKEYKYTVSCLKSHKKTVKKTLTSSEFMLFTTVTEQATHACVAFHADQVCCTWLQVFTKYFIVIWSINYGCCDIFRYLVKRNEIK